MIIEEKVQKILGDIKAEDTSVMVCSNYMNVYFTAANKKCFIEVKNGSGPTIMNVGGDSNVLVELLGNELQKSISLLVAEAIAFHNAKTLGILDDKR